MIPSFLKNNSKIYLVAPSFGCTFSPYNDRLLESIKILKNMGYDIYIGPNCFKNNNTASNTAKKRAKEFMDAYKSDVDLILSVGGGEVMCEILPYISFDKIKKLKPKWFMGYSDNTNLTYTLTTICDIETIYGPHAPSFYTYPLEYDTLDAIRLLNGELEFNDYGKWEYSTKKSDNPLEPYHLNKNSKIIAHNYTAPFNGRLIGGCLDCLITLCGTKYDNTINYINNHNEGIIFFLEACDLNSIQITRALFQLKNSNWFKNIKGFIIGRSNNYYDKSFGITPKSAYLKALKDYNVPILLDVDLGHLGPSIPLRCGAYAEISLINNRLHISYTNSSNEEN